MAPPRSASAGSNVAWSRELWQPVIPSRSAAQSLPPATTTNNDWADKERLTKYRQHRGVCSFGVEVVADLLGCRSVRRCGKGVRRGLLDAAHTPEVFNQPLSRPWSNARYRKQLTIAVAHLP